MTTTENLPTTRPTRTLTVWARPTLWADTVPTLVADVPGFGYYECKADRLATWTVAAAVARMTDIHECEHDGAEQVAVIRALADSNELGALAVRIMAADVSPGDFTY